MYLSRNANTAPRFECVSAQFVTIETNYNLTKYNSDYKPRNETLPIWVEFGKCHVVITKGRWFDFGFNFIAIGRNITTDVPMIRRTAAAKSFAEPILAVAVQDISCLFVRGL